MHRRQDPRHRQHHDPSRRRRDGRRIRPRQLDVRHRTAEHDVWHDQRRTVASSSTATERSRRPHVYVAGHVQGQRQPRRTIDGGCRPDRRSARRSPAAARRHPEPGRRMRRRQRGLSRRRLVPDRTGAASTEARRSTCCRACTTAAGRSAAIRPWSSPRASTSWRAAGSTNSGGSITSVQGGTGDPAPGADLQHGQPGHPYRSGERRPHRLTRRSSSTRSTPARTRASCSGTTARAAIRRRSSAWAGRRTSTSPARSTARRAWSTWRADRGSRGSTNTASIQVIAWQFDVGGNGNLDMPYDPNQLYQFPAKGLVH